MTFEHRKVHLGWQEENSWDFNEIFVKSNCCLQCDKTFEKLRTQYSILYSLFGSINNRCKGFNVVVQPM